MDIRQRADLFTRYAGLELKGKITARGYTAKEVASLAHRSPAAFNRWLNGKVDLPLAVLFEACEIIDVEPAVIVQAAYDRVLDDGADVASGSYGGIADLPLAAKRGRRRVEPDAAE